MIIMDKFKKRIWKLIKHPKNAIVIGNGFGKLNELAEVFSTLFVFSWGEVSLKRKNIVSRENFLDLNQLSDVCAIIIDLNQIHHLSSMTEIWHRHQVYVLIEGDAPIGRELSQSLYASHFKCIDQHGFYHVWKQQ